jgi:hypothetical protein
MVPTIVDYSIVQQTAAEMGLVSLYHNSGAYGFGAGAAVGHVGWIGQPDATLRASARDSARQVRPPYPENMATGVEHFARMLKPSAVWLLPASHWAYELRFGGQWVGQLLDQLNLEASALRDRADGSAIAFMADEMTILSTVIATLLEKLPAGGSDFSLLAPPRRVVGMIHHHQQVWWTTADTDITALLRDISLEP